MGRHVLSVPRAVRTSRELRRSTTVEVFLSNVYIAAMLCFTIGCLSFTPVIPYVSHHRWAFFLAASVALVLLNMRDMWVLLPGPGRELAVDEQTFGKDALGAATRRRLGAASESLFNTDTFSAAVMVAGSLMLFNASVLATMHDATDPAARWQFLGAFGAYIIGYASNTMTYHDDALEVIETRNAVVFQMSMASTLNLIGAIADAPGLGCSENDELRATLRSWLHGLGGLIALGATLVNHFHTMAFTTNEELLFAERRYKAVAAKRDQEVVSQPELGLLERVWGVLTGVAARVGLQRAPRHRGFRPVGPDAADDDDWPNVCVTVSDGEVSDPSSGSLGSTPCSSAASLSSSADAQPGPVETESGSEAEEEEVLQPEREECVRTARRRRSNGSCGPMDGLERSGSEVDADQFSRPSRGHSRRHLLEADDATDSELEEGDPPRRGRSHRSDAPSGRRT
jgi:hypothetical protein